LGSTVSEETGIFEQMCLCAAEGSEKENILFCTAGVSAFINIAGTMYVLKPAKLTEFILQKRASLSQSRICTYLV
jgi:hypothetical protein